MRPDEETYRGELHDDERRQRLREQATATLIIPTTPLSVEQIRNLRRIANRDGETVQLREYAASSDRELKIDEKEGVIRGVKICGTRSSNRVDYPPHVLAAAAHLYEGAPCFCGHAPAGKMPAVGDQVGVHRNIKVKDGGLFSDLHLNMAHPVAGRIIWNARHDAKHLCLSHDIDARCTTRNGRRLVEEILSVRSVDLVVKGGTVDSLFESAGDGPVRPNALRKFTEGESTPTGLAAIMGASRPKEATTATPSKPTTKRNELKERFQL